MLFKFVKMRNIHFFQRALFISNSVKVRYFASEPKKQVDITKLRNIGILAHIDAGKTTTTERMLFFSGKLHSMGEVHHGNTVTDYMEQERERGITITSAAVTFPWRNHVFNLIDTPGHIDFTMEVEQSLNVLDGAIIVLDASAGVEAQTVTIWKQAEKYKIPRIVYVNKTDRSDADVFMCCKSIEAKLDIASLLLHLPIRQNNKLIGIVDILSLDKIMWEIPGKGKIIQKYPLSEDDNILWEQAKISRNSLIDKLCDEDDELAELIIRSDSMDNISAKSIAKSVKKLTETNKAVPVLCGSAYKNIGIQNLMDAIILYLPSPVERNNQYQSFDNNLCARAFKVIHENQKGPLVFFRVYSGKFTKGQKIYNIHKDINEQSNKLYVAYADEFQEVNEVTNGNIAVLTGLKKTMTGDMITSNVQAFTSAKKKLTKQLKNKNLESNVNKLFNIDQNIPEPVFFCSIETPSLMYQTPLENALKELEREDPSLRVSYDSETGQTVLAGMGELHLEIIKDRIKKKYKIDASLGPLQIAYKEAPIQAATTENIVETRIGNTKHSVNVKLSIEPCEDKEDRDILKLDKSPEAAANLAKIYPRHLLAVKQGVDIALNHGPKLGCRLVNISVILHHLYVGRGTSETIISTAITQSIQKLLKEHGSKILEPVMQMEIVTNEEYLSSVLADLSRRRTVVQNIDAQGKNKIVHTLTPLAEIMDYSKILRTVTSGTASVNIQFSSYETMSSLDETTAIRNVTGF